jgi:4-alpha-glucanotransferase
VITPDVIALREELGFPGMVVLLWAFQRDPTNPHRLENHRERQVVYTTTHDTASLREHWPDEEPWQLIEYALSSRAAIAMMPAQDVLGLGSEGRMNRPGEPFGNWRWRLEPGQLTPALAERLHAVTAIAGRLPNP